MKGLAFLLCAFVLASCARFSNAPLPAAVAANAPHVRVTDQKITRVFSFDGANGKESAASLIDVAGLLYGTTYAGGARDEGTVFSTSPSGAHHVLHSFKGGSDGALPLANVTNVHGAFYGTTVNGGGAGGEGVVFKVSDDGAESIIHRFGSSGDGANPYGGLVELGGKLYGTTAGGGSASAGTVVAITIRSGSERVLYSFSANGGDGSTPAAGLIDVNGVLYGTTQYGGGHCGSVGCGAVFTITPSGHETLIYGFKGGTDGSMPAAPLIDFRGTLYGTTAQGGTSNAGTVFKIASGKESVIYSFRGGADGAVPQSLVALKGTLYGTTSAGGPRNAGTIFAVTPGGKERLLHAFRGGVDGATPRAGLCNVRGTLYGTTAAGGESDAGTIFRITP